MFENRLRSLKDIFDCDYNTLNLPNKTSYNKFKKNKVKEDECSLLIESNHYNEFINFIKIKNLNERSLLFSIYAYVMHKYSNQNIIYTSFINDVVVTNENNNANLIGSVFNIQPLLIKFNIGKKDYTLSNIYKSINYYHSLYKKKNVSFSELVEKFHLLKVNNGFIFESTKDDKSIIESCTDFENFDIIFKVTHQQDSYRMAINYDCNKYDKYLIKNILGSINEIISKISENYDKNLYDVEYIPFEEKNRILCKFNSKKVDYGRDKFYHVEFSKIAKKHFNDCALIFEDEEFTYGQLDTMSNSLANYLREKLFRSLVIVPIIL